MKRHFFTIALSAPERARLGELANQSGRSCGGVVKQLLKIADTPEVRRVLGLDPQPETMSNISK